jgi:ribulose-5-phosphate 4-epimerase/fuculose-1-phosphate aldolase
MYEDSKEAVWRSNLELPRQKLVIYSWGNVSGIDRRAGVVAIKPSGVAYDEFMPDKIVVLNFAGEAVEGSLRPSSDTPTHLELYRSFTGIGGICHTHSVYATMWAPAANHGPFTWGSAPEAAVVLEQAAMMALGTLTLGPKQESISQVLPDKHYLRKHGKGAYYGQK